MKNIIEELFYGNIDTQARTFTKDSNVKKIYDKINDIEEQLTNKHYEKEKILFLDFINAHSEVSAESSLHSFIIGFRLGARFVYDTFMSDTTPFYNYLE